MRIVRFAAQKNLFLLWNTEKKISTPENNEKQQAAFEKYILNWS